MNRNILSNIFIIFSFAVITVFCIMLINQLTINAKSDRIYNNFYGQNSLHMNVTSTETDLAFDPVGLAENYVVYRTFNLFAYKDYGSDFVRAVYGEGDFPVPNMLDGEFFTNEQLLSDTPLCILGYEAENRAAIELNGKKYYPYNGVNYEIIGHIGENKATDLDIIVMLNWNGYFSNYGNYIGDYLFDGNNAVDINNAFDEFQARINKFKTDGKDVTALNILYKPAIRTIDTITQVCYYLAVIVLVLNIMITAFYYAKRKEYMTAVKKLTGYSQPLLIFEAIREYMIYAVIGFVIGIIGLILASKTEVFLSSELSYFSDISVPTVLLTLVLISALSLIVVTIPVMRIFKTDTSYVLK